MWLIVTAATTGCTRPNAQPPNAGTSQSAPTALSVVKPQRMSLPKVIEQPGTIRAYEETPLYAKLAGFVKIVNVDIGDRVEGPTPISPGNTKPGTVLAEISIPELEDEAREKQAHVARADAEREQAAKQGEVADASHAAAEAQVVEAQAGLRKAQAAYDRWQSESTRVSALVRDRVVDAQTGEETRKQFLSAESARDEAQAHVMVTEKAVLKSKAEQEKSKADVKAMAARVKVAEAEAARVQSLLEYRFIRAPFTGTVTSRNLDTGHFVHPAGGGKAMPLFTVVRMDTVRVSVKVPEADAALVRKGTPARITIQALKGPEFAAAVSRTTEALESGSRTLRAEIDLPNPDGKLRPGMYAYARITAPMPEAWVLPATAVVKQADVTVCFVHRDGKAVRLPIQTGRSDGTWTEVLKNQAPGVLGMWEDWTGTELVLAGLTSGLTDGQPVEPKP